MDAGDRTVPLTTSPDVEPSAVIAAMTVGHVTLDTSWRLTQVNAAAAKILGRPVDALLGRELWAEFEGARELEFGRVFESVMASREPDSLEAYYPGLAAWFEVRVQPTAEGIACYFLDVTARRAMERQVVASAARAGLLAGVADSLGADLDLEANVARLARLVVPQLGSWSIVTLVDDGGGLRDAAWWHVDPSRLEEVRQYAAIRLAAMPGTIAAEAFASGRPAVVMDNAHAVIRARLTEPVALALFDKLRPQASAVLPLLARGRMVGVLTLYSDEPWTEHQYETAIEVSARAALSLDNCVAYARADAARADAEDARTQAEAAGRRLALFARVSEALAVTADADEAVGLLARLVVPQLADWSLVTIVDEDNVLHDVGMAHRDPAREREVAAYALRRSAMMTSTAPLATVMRTGEPMVLAEVSDEVLTDAQPDERMAQLARGLEPHGLAVIPLRARGRVLGALTLVTTRERGPHTAPELSAALEVAQRAGPVLESARTSQRARHLAESVQRSMLAVAPTGPGLQIAARYRPAQVDNEVGGDWYDHFDLPDGSTVVTMGDVMGHDTAAIAAMAQLRTFMRANAWTGRRSPAEVLTDTDSVSRALGPGTFATAITGELGPALPDGSVPLQWSNAGHLPPAVVSPGGGVQFLRTSHIDLPLGVLAEAPRRDHTVILDPGSTLLFFTDGLVERRDRDIEDGLGELCRVLAAVGSTDLEPALDKVLVEMSSSDPYGDDIAIMAVRIADRRSVDRSVAAGGRSSITLPADATASAIGREHLSRLAGIPAEVLADAALLASELISNALRHGTPPFRLEVDSTDERLWVGVVDRSAGQPMLPTHAPGADQASGRGLIIIDAIAESWGVSGLPGDAGKTVWFTLLTG